MADYTITVTGTVRCFGQGPSSLWNAYSWNAFKWGEGTVDIKTDVRHLISESTSPDTGFAQKKVRHLISETATFADGTIYRSYPKSISESLSLAGEMSSEQVLDGSGYNRVFQGGVTDAESRTTTTWTSGTFDTETWATATAATTTWSQA